MSRKSSKGGWRPAWMNKELWQNSDIEKKLYKRWKQGEVTWKEYRHTAWTRRDRVRKGKTHLLLSLARYLKGNQKEFYRYIGSKKKTRENVGLMLNEVGTCWLRTLGRWRYCMPCWPQSLLLSPVFRNPRSLRPEKVGIKAELSPVEENLVRECLNKLDVRKSLVPHRMHPQVLRKVASVTASPLSIISIILARSEQPGEDTDDWKKENVTPSSRMKRRIQGT